MTPTNRNPPIEDLCQTYPNTLRFYCALCRDDSVFRGADTIKHVSKMDIPLTQKQCSLQLIAYRCAHCDKQRLVFAIHYEWRCEGGINSQAWQKIGQFPPWEGAPNNSRAIKKALGSEAYSLFCKGTSLLGASFGIGAAAYFRRAVEMAVNELLNYTSGLAEAENDLQLRDKCIDAQRGRVAEEKLRLVSHHVPESLKAYGGSLPLKQLYDTFSQDIHYKSDEDALVDALIMKTTMEHVFVGMREVLKTARKYNEDMARAMAESKALQAKNNLVVTGEVGT